LFFLKIGKGTMRKNQKISETCSMEKEKNGLRPGGRKRRILTSARGSYKAVTGFLILSYPPM
jgi:hypothetical protein